MFQTFSIGERSGLQAGQFSTRTLLLRSHDVVIDAVCGFALSCWNTRHLIECSLPSILDIFLTRCSSKAKSIVEDPTHPSHSLFQLLPSGRRYRSIRARSARLLNSFFPQAVRALNSHHTALSETLNNTPHPPPPPTHPTPPPYHISGKKLLKLLFLCNSGERACTSHL